MIRLTAQTRLLVLTGAGVSAESGIPTFRGAGGLWENEPVERVASPEGFRADPERVWRFYSARRKAALPCVPNPSHATLVEVERRLGDRFLLVTQNVDGLHPRAGSERLVELHGNLFRTRCSGCARAPFADEAFYEAAPLPTCDGCHALLRPDIVWFGEMLNPEHLERVEDFLRRPGRCVFLAAGTSGSVWPAAGLVDWARAAGAETWLLNADPAENGARFEHVKVGRSGELFPTLFAFG